MVPTGLTGAMIFSTPPRGSMSTVVAELLSNESDFSSPQGPLYDAVFDGLGIDKTHALAASRRA